MDEPVREELVGVFTAHFGKEKASELVDGAASSLGLRPAMLTPPDGLNVLEKLAENPGLVGISARFAKSRLHLKWRVDR
jgi:hypothetical protein